MSSPTKGNKQPETNELPTALHLKRFLRAPQQAVFDAWSQPARVAEWWGPRGFIARVHEWDTHTHGRIHMTMAMEDGSWKNTMTGAFVEFVRPSRLHFVAAVPDAEGHPLFETLNTVRFEAKDCGTEVTLDAQVTRQESPNAAQFLKGMRDGWNQTLDRLVEAIGSSPERDPGDSHGRT